MGTNGELVNISQGTCKRTYLVSLGGFFFIILLRFSFPSLQLHGPQRANATLLLSGENLTKHFDNVVTTARMPMQLDVDVDVAVDVGKF